MNKIFVKESDIPKTQTRIELLRRFVKGKFNTYEDSGCTVIQCEKGKYRSVTELHEIVLSRFPKTTFNAILRIIRDLINEDYALGLVWCTQVNKVVVKYTDNATRGYITKYSKDHYWTTKGVDGYSLEDYSKIINNL